MQFLVDILFHILNVLLFILELILGIFKKSDDSISWFRVGIAAIIVIALIAG